MGFGWGWQPYVSVAERKRKAAKSVEKMKKSGRAVMPVEISGRSIATTFWGKAWCDNLESYSDYENRLPRGRTYVRNGSVVDLQIEPGKVTSLVSGSSLYKIEISIKPLERKTWDTIKNACAGKIESLIELLKGKLSKGVMEAVTKQEGGLFPQHSEISLKCSCPDSAIMCKHVAATLYGVGARLDHSPELLFKLREVDHLELISQADTGANLGKTISKDKVLSSDSLEDLFGIDIESNEFQEKNIIRPDETKDVYRAGKDLGLKNKKKKSKVKKSKKTKAKKSSKKAATTQKIQKQSESKKKTSKVKNKKR